MKPDIGPTQARRVVRHGVSIAVVGAALVGCSLVGGEENKSSRLVATTDSIGIAWVPGGIYSLDIANGTGKSELQRLDPDTGAATPIPWPDQPCPESFRSGPYAGVDGRVYVAQVCNYILGSDPRESSYIVYDPETGAWSSLIPTVWGDTTHGRLSWDATEQEGLFTTPDQSCSTLYRLTAAGPALIGQTVPTPHGDVDLRAGLTLDPPDDLMVDAPDNCLRDGRVLGAPANARGQVALMVSPVRGPAGPSRLGAESALVLATWTPGEAKPLSDFTTLAEGIDSASPPVWSADGTAVFYSSDGESIMRIDVESGERSEAVDEGADEVVASPDGTRLALRDGIIDADDEPRSEIRIAELKSTP